MSPMEARRVALLDLGGVVQTKEAIGNVRVLSVERIWQDARYALRAMWKHPAFTALAVVTLALGIGVNAASLAVAYGILVRPLAYVDIRRHCPCDWRGRDPDNVPRRATSAQCRPACCPQVRMSVLHHGSTSGASVVLTTAPSRCAPRQPCRSGHSSAHRLVCDWSNNGDWTRTTAPGAGANPQPARLR